MSAFVLRPLLVGVGVVAAAASLAAGAPAAEILTRNATDVRLAVSADGKALVTYRRGGRLHRVLAWGAVNAVPPSPTGRQVSFRVDYSGGWRAFRMTPQRFRGACGAYDGPPLRFVVAACKAPDGSYWALQTWQRMLPNYGLPASPARAVYELRLSHWRGPLPVLEIGIGWTQRRYHTLFGRFTYLAKPVHGFSTTRRGAPRDSFGRLLYVDTWNSAYGRGWRRENSFVTHKGTGAFCYGFFPHAGRPSGMGTRYRAIMMSPGVLPDIVWEAAPPAAYDPAYDAAQRERVRALRDRLCG